MFCTNVKRQLQLCHHKMEDLDAQLSAVSRSTAVITFDLQGSVLTANDNFLTLMGYQLSEIQGKHHRLFVDPKEVNSSDYGQFWQALNQGKFFARRFKRITKSGVAVWLEASYYPIIDSKGKPYKVIKLASDITEQVMRESDVNGQLAAINRAMATIEFDLSGKVLTANDNFLSLLGYSLSEVVGQHHRLFVEPSEVNSHDYAQFWQTLASGSYVARTFKRLTKSGKPVWIEASYNPIMDVEGKPYKVVKYATDVTANETAKQSLAVAMNEAAQVLSAMSAGDLTQRMQGSYQDSLAQLQQAINQMAERLQGVVVAAVDSANVVGDASEQVSQGSSDLSSRVQQQAAALEETSATMNEMASAVQANTANARKVADLTRQVQTQSSEGVTVMQQTITAMQSIRESSHKISDIVTIIDSIAFQTNLLALNAAVEAARAGEHGRGFAVVASEVRALAGKSADAAKDIKHLITDSVTRIENGTQLADKSGEVLGGISLSVEQVASMIDQIATASNEQSVGINQVHQAMSDIDRATQENAALVQETTVAADSLSQEADSLRSNMAFFKTGSTVREPTRSATSRPKTVVAERSRSVGLPAPKKANNDEWGEF